MRDVFLQCELRSLLEANSSMLVLGKVDHSAAAPMTVLCFATLREAATTKAHSEAKWRRRGSAAAAAQPPPPAAAVLLASAAARRLPQSDKCAIVERK